MGFDIVFMSSHWDSEEVESTTPFTGEVQKERPNLPLTSGELEAAQSVLNDANPEGPDEDDCYLLEFPDGSGAEVEADDSNTGWIVSIQAGLSPPLLEFLWRFLKAGNLVMCPVMDELLTIGPSQEILDGAPDDMPRKVVCSSPEELGQLLSGGYSAWKRYRDQVVGD